MERREGHEDGRGQAQMAKTGSRSLAPTLLTYWTPSPQPSAKSRARGQKDSVESCAGIICLPLCTSPTSCPTCVCLRMLPYVGPLNSSPFLASIWVWPVKKASRRQEIRGGRRGSFPRSHPVGSQLSGGPLHMTDSASGSRYLCPPSGPGHCILP